ncbi:cation diffusion facilitator family transporter [Brevundimonas lenta]|uniref:Putative Co/Zn/Cd cation transporter (Cation efflux family) n=1 Tax=Brevundimonas lenta TaxID=424796 RepID=A0A7W6JEQ3_9CAUL|nr:cation transporter [Brevundimonas lenta]MBB4083754.1 putative Co/Zn/Cd cation transporter (cation efflux family) [Brevundimonas lenta]
MNASADTAREQRLLKVSIAAVAVMGVVTVAFGLWSGSSAITFDGFYSLADVGMTWLALIITRLISRGDDDRFQFGYWHLEPLIGLVNGAVLAMACAYAFADSLAGLRAGGRLIDFGPGALFSGAMAVIGLVMWLYIRRSAAGLSSQILKIDARAWLMGACLSAALCAGFVIGGALRDSPAAHLAPYADPVVLLIVSLTLMPFPFLTLWRSARDILQIAPSDLSDHVREVARVVAARHGFEPATHIARTGRQLFIEIALLAPSDATTLSFGQLDAIRAEISDALGMAPGFWLTVEFTADRRWV